MGTKNNMLRGGSHPWLPRQRRQHCHSEAASIPGTRPKKTHTHFLSQNTRKEFIQKKIQTESSTINWTEHPFNARFFFFFESSELQAQGFVSSTNEKESPENIDTTCKRWALSCCPPKAVGANALVSVFCTFRSICSSLLLQRLICSWKDKSKQT